MPESEHNPELILPAENSVVPTRADLQEALRKSEQSDDNREKNHLISNLQSDLTLRFQIGQETGWLDEEIFKFKICSQTLRLFSENKIKKNCSAYFWLYLGNRSNSL